MRIAFAAQHLQLIAGEFTESYGRMGGQEDLPRSRIFFGSQRAEQAHDSMRLQTIHSSSSIRAMMAASAACRWRPAMSSRTDPVPRDFSGRGARQCWMRWRR